MTAPTAIGMPLTEELLASYIRDELLFGTVPELSPTDDLLASGLLDSMAVVTLVGYLEQQLGRRIPDTDITVENFVSVENICTYLRRG